jgi:hypothetical protein
MGLRHGTEIIWEMLHKICDNEGFAVPCYTIEEVLVPFRVREARGRLISVNLDGTWPEGTRLLFEIRPAGKGTKIKRVEADAQGRFAIKGLRDGQYCFMASCWGWESYLGAVIVDKHADPGSEIFIEMHLAGGPH